MKKAGKITLKDAVTLNDSEMRNIFGGSGNSGIWTGPPGYSGHCAVGYSLFSCVDECDNRTGDLCAYNTQDARYYFVKGRQVNPYDGTSGCEEGSIAYVMCTLIPTEPV